MTPNPAPGRLFLLAEEYTTLVEAQRSGEHDETEYNAIGSQRTVVHNELLWLTGLTRETDMYHWCRMILSNRPQ